MPGTLNANSLKLSLSPFVLEDFFKGYKHVPEEKDQGFNNLTELDLSQCYLVTSLRRGQISTTGEESLSRLKERSVNRCGATVFQALWQDYVKSPKDSILETFFYQSKKAVWVEFFGDIFLDKRRDRVNLALCRHVSGCWLPDSFWLSNRRLACHPILIWDRAV